MYLVKDIAIAIDGVLHGDGELVIQRAAEPALAGPKDLAIALTKPFLAQIPESRASVAILADGTAWESLGLKAAISVERGRLAMSRLTQALDNQPKASGQQHPTAVIAPTAQVSKDVDVGPFAVIGPDVVIGAGTRIGAHVSIAAGARIGAGVTLADGCRIGRNVSLGDNVWSHSNVVIGSDGFSYVTTEPAHVELSRKTLGQSAPPELSDPTWHRIHSLGGVVIEDDVEIGANSAIDAGTLRPTRIGKGTKLDNMVHIGHNVVVGQHCLLCGQVGIAGTTEIGDRTVIGGQAGIADNITVGADVVIGGASGVFSNVAAGRVMLGSPAVRMTTHIESYKALRRLPRLLARLSGKKTGFKAGEE